MIVAREGLKENAKEEIFNLERKRFPPISDMTPACGIGVQNHADWERPHPMGKGYPRVPSPCRSMRFRSTVPTRERFEGKSIPRDAWSQSHCSTEKRSPPRATQRRRFFDPEQFV
jgi:hypothetical protein